MQILKTIEKSEFCVLIKHCFLMGGIPFKQSTGIISVIWTLLLQKQRLRGGMWTLNMVVQIQMMLNSSFVPENTKKLHKLVLANCKLKLHEIPEELKISEGSVFTILHEHLSMRKLCSKWVSCLLTVNQKQQRINNSRRCLQLFQQNKKKGCV